MPSSPTSFRASLFPKSRLWVCPLGCSCERAGTPGSWGSVPAAGGLFSRSSRAHCRWALGDEAVLLQAMTLMEYLIKTGSERVSQQCKENMYAVQTLKDFQYVDRDGKDQGVNVREKARQLVALLRDEDRLREERAHALKTKEKLAQTATGEWGSPQAGIVVRHQQTGGGFSADWSGWSGDAEGRGCRARLVLPLFAPRFLFSLCSLTPGA